MPGPQLLVVPPPPPFTGGSQMGTGAHGTIMNGGGGHSLINGPTMTGTVIRPEREPMYGTMPTEAQLSMGAPMPMQQGGGGESMLVPAAQRMGGDNVRVVEHIPLAKTRVLYLGSAVPMETAVGLEAVQLPLRERYAADGASSVEGIDTWLSVFSSGVIMQYVGDRNSVTWWPISSLHVCAAVKCVMQSAHTCDGGMQCKFVALDSSAGKQSSHPPMFAAIMRRNKGIKVLECHVFICKSDQAAMALVQSCTHAYEHKELWTNEQPPIEMLFRSETHIIPAENDGRDPKVSGEFYEKPPPQGYFYSSRKDLVRNYNIAGDSHLHALPGPRGPLPPPPPPMIAGPVPRLPLPPPPNMLLPPPGPMPMMPLPPPPPPHMMPMPPPPAGYFADWDNFAGRPVGVFPPQEIYTQQRPRRKLRRHRSPDRRRRDSSSDSSGSEYSEYYYEKRPRSPPADYREPTYDYDRRVPRGRDHPPPQRDFPRGYDRGDHYRERRDYDREDLVLYAPRYMRNIPPDDHRDRPSPRDERPSPRDSAPRHREYEDRSAPPPPPPPPASRPRDYDDYYPTRRDRDDRGRGGGAANGERNGYAPPPQQAAPPPPPPPPLPEPRPVRREVDGHITYNTNNNPDIIMKESEDFKEARRHRPDNSRYDSSARDRDFGTMDSQRYPRNDREFGNSIREERRAVGDLYSEDAYRPREEDIDFGNFQRRGDESRRNTGRQQGKPYENLENSLGYFP